MSKADDGGTYANLIREVAARAPDEIALAFKGVELTYAQLLANGSRRARELKALGIGKGDNFGLLLPNSHELVEFLVGGALVGAVTVPINTRYRTGEIRHICRDGRLRAVVTTSALDAHVSLRELLYGAFPELRLAQEPLRLSLADAPDLRAVVLLDGADAGLVPGGTLRSLSEEQPEPTAVDGPDPDDPIVIMYTSGTTANPKGCVTANSSLVANAADIAERFEVPAGDRWWNPLPMFHMGAILLMTAVFSRAGRFISMRHFEPEAAFDLIGEHQATVLYPLFPTITLELLHSPRFASLDQDRIRIICNVAPHDLQVQIQEAFPRAVLISAYGMTEVCGSAAYSNLEDPLDLRTTTCGQLLPSWDARIVDPETGLSLTPGSPGELRIRGPYLFRGYFGDPGQTAAAIDDEGYLKTGDHCSLDAAGYLSFHGRLKDQLKVGGENVSALEVESFLATNPAIKLAQVVGIPDDRYGEVPAAFVELAPDSELTEPEVIEFCTGQIARFKIPRHVRFVTDWPMSSTKVQKFRLRDALVEELSSQPTA
jgi:acyl-CoA synthetase (AMP-forming)/AMP-acid ligase II